MWRMWGLKPGVIARGAKLVFQWDVEIRMSLVQFTMMACSYMLLSYLPFLLYRLQASKQAKRVLLFSSNIGGC